MSPKLVKAVLYDDGPCAINPAHVLYLHRAGPDRVCVAIFGGEKLYIKGVVADFFAGLNGADDVAAALEAAGARDAESSRQATSPRSLPATNSIG